MSLQEDRIEVFGSCVLVELPQLKNSPYIVDFYVFRSEVFNLFLEKELHFQFCLSTVLVRVL